jgi:hypothetical protein
MLQGFQSMEKAAQWNTGAAEAAAIPTPITLADAPRHIKILVKP